MAPTRGFAHLTGLTKRSSGNISKSAFIGVTILFSLIAIIAVALTTYAYINHWKLPIFQSLAETARKKVQPLLERKRLSKHSQRLQSEAGIESSTATETERRPASRPSKYWSAEDISRSKIGSTMSHVPSVRAFGTDTNVFKPPTSPSIKTEAMSGYAASIFSSRTKVSAFMNADGTPQVVRPSSRRVKTASRHISMQFLPDVVEPVPPLPSPTRTEDSLEMKREPSLSLKELLDLNRRSSKDLEDAAKTEKRNSRAVVTNLNWMQYETETK